MKNIIKTAVAGLSAVADAFSMKAFCNIAEGTHAGHITMRAADDIDQSNLVVKFTEGGIAPANVGDIPAGVCTDCGETGDFLDVALPGCAESSFVCVCDSSVNAGDTLYTSAGGKVSTFVSAASYKVGVALSSVVGGGLVEVDPQSFGSSAYKIVACGSYTWKTSGSSENMDVNGVNENDFVIASISKNAGAEKTVFASLDADTRKIAFKLDQNGAAGSTKINWIIARA